MTDTRDGIFGSVPEDEYHSDRGSLSVSGAKLLLPPSCPAKFREHIDNPPKPKPQYTFGHAVHSLVLGKGATIIEVDAPDWRSKAAREQRDLACNGVAPILTAELEIARAMERVVREHPTAGPLFAGGDAETSMYTTDPVTGVRLRGRADWLTVRDGRLWICDYKTSTTSNPTDFARLAYTYRYFCQASWYIDLAIAVGLSDQPVFVDVCQEKQPPYVVSVVEFDADALAEGRRLNRQAIDLYAECVAADCWPAYGDGVHRIGLPQWVSRGHVDADAEALIKELEGLA